MDASDEVRKLHNFVSFRTESQHFKLPIFFPDLISKFSSNLKDLRELFKSIDVDNDQSLCLSEVVTFLKSLTDDLSTDNIEKIFDSLDKSGDRSVDFSEFKVNFAFQRLNCNFVSLLGCFGRNSRSRVEAM